MATIACIEETTALTTQTMITPTEAPTETGEAYQALKMPRASLPGAITPVKPQSSGIDSGYASQSSTPDKFEDGFSSHSVENGSVVKGARLWPSRKTVKLKHFVDKKIPQLTQSRFEDLRELHAGKLNVLTRGLPRCQGILMTLAVLGESEEKAAPWIFIQCDKRVAKKVRGFFAVPEVKLDFQPLHPVPYSPHFQIYVKELPPMMLGQVFPPEASPGPGTTQRMEMVDIYIAKGLDFDPYSSDTLCGTAIQTCPQGDHRTATLGGLIEVRNQDGSHDILGITAGHFLRQGSYDDADDSETLTDGSDDTFSDDGYEFDLDIDTTTNSEHGLEQERPATTIARTWQKLGIVYESSQDTVETARNLDWALIRIESPELYLPNAILGHKIVRSSPAYSNSAEAEAILSDKKVKLITGESGSRSGILSWSWSYLMLFPGDILTRAYSLTLSDNQVLQTGDSGSWVIDAYSSEVYGHVVASDVFGKVYVVPMEDILQDIKERLKASSVRLAPASHVLAKRRSHLETQQPPTSRPQLAQSNAYSHPNAPHISGTADENELPDAKLRTHYAMMRSETTTPKPPQYPKPESQLPDSGYSTMHNTPSNSPPPASTSLPIAGWKPAFLRTGTDPSPKTVEDKSIHGEDDPNWATLVAGAIAGTLPLVAAAVVSARAEHEKSTGTSTIDDSAQTETNMTAAEEPSKDHKFRTIWKILRKNIKIQKE